MNEFPRIDEALADATDRLGPVSESARLDAELLLARALDVPRSYLFAHPEDRLDAAAASRFDGVIERRLSGMPMAYITGEKEFWSMTLHVSPDTLVPRPESELLVERALLHIPRKSELAVLDLGTGSGAIALAIARERPLCSIVATDISAGAITVARENARRHGLPNVEFHIGNWTQPVRDQEFNVIVSNPPYIATADSHLAALRFEPRNALTSGPDGLDDIRELSATLHHVLAAQGVVIIEHGAEQASQVQEIFQRDGWTGIETIRDLAGLPRITTAVRR